MSVISFSEARELLQTAPPLKDRIFEEIVEFAAEGVNVVDRSRRIVYWNPAAEAISGYDAASVLGRVCSGQILRPCDATGVSLCDTRCSLIAAMSGGEPETVDVHLLHRDGRRVPVRLRSSPVRDGAGRIIGSIEMFHDMTQPLTILEDLRAAQEREQLDPLTGLGNRRLIETTLRALTTDARPVAPSAGVLFLDIDHFKQVNDRYGHLAGDRVIKEVGMTIAGALRASDIVSRWGGEEFVVISPGADLDAISALGERMRALVAAMRIPSGLGEVAVTISLGASVIRRPESAENLVARADRLMYASKRAGRDRLTAG